MGRITDWLLGRAVPRARREFDAALRSRLPRKLAFYAHPTATWVGAGDTTYEIVAHRDGTFHVRVYGSAGLAPEHVGAPASQELTDRFRVIWNVHADAHVGAATTELIDDGSTPAASQIAPLLEPLRAVGVVSVLAAPGDLSAVPIIDEHADATQAAQRVGDVLERLEALLPACNARFTQLAP